MTSVVDTQGRFKIVTPLSFFEKAGVPEGEQRRFGGLVTTDSVDREGEVVLQSGLNFQPFLTHGWFNDNHNGQTGMGVGVPTGVSFYRAGEVMPDGNRAPANGHWAEGVLLRGHEPAEKIWSLAQSLKKSPSPRRLGFSIEGKIKARGGADGKLIAAADVYEIAITRCPMNTDTKMDILGKALGHVSKSLGSVQVPGAHREPDGDEKLHGQGIDPDAPIDSYDEQIRGLLAGLHGIVSTIKIDLGQTDNEFERQLDAARTPLGKSGGAAAQGEENNMNGKIDSLEALAKSVAALQEAFAQTPAGRRQALLAKAQSGAISADEQDELVKSLTGTLGVAASAKQALVNEDLSKAARVDASGFLGGLAKSFEASVGKIGEAFEKSDARHTQVETALVKGMLELGTVLGELAKQNVELQKSQAALSAQVEKVLELPARGPKSTPPAVANAADRLGAAAPTGGRTISKGVILDGLTKLAEKGEVSLKCGVTIGDATALIEGTDSVAQGSPAHRMMDAITREVLGSLSAKE